MINIEIGCSKLVFAEYVGLLHSGYSLTNKKFVYLREHILSNLQLDSDILDYFMNSVSETCKVNPYWPFGFVLAVISLHIEKESLTSLSDRWLIDVLSGLNQVDQRLFDESTVEWLKQLPRILDRIINMDGFENSWRVFQEHLFEDELEIFKESVYHKIETSLGETQCDEKIIMILNPLQAVQQTDCVKINETIYIIEALPDEKSIIHEYLHHYFEDAFQANTDEIHALSNLLIPINDKMIDYQYAWDDSKESWFRVFEECFMRAGSVWIEHQDNEKVLEIINTYVYEGFVYVEPIVRCFQEKWSQTLSPTKFILMSLEECKQYKHATSFNTT